RQHDDRHARFGSDLAANIDAVQPRQHQVEQHQVGAGIPERLHGVIAVGDEHRVKPLTPEHDAEHLGDGGVVNGDQDTALHGPHRATEISVEAPARGPRRVPRSCSVPALTGRAIPCSVTSAVTSSGGVTSKAGLCAALPGGATAVPANDVTSSSGRCSTLMSRPPAAAKSTVDTGAATTNGTPWWCASTASP